MEDKKKIVVKSKSQFRRITLQGGNPVMGRECPNCGGGMIWEEEYEWYVCHDCGCIMEEEPD